VKTVEAARAQTTDGAHTRARVARTLLEQGPSTATAVAERVGLTPAAVRRHLDSMVADGLVESCERAPYGPLAGRRGRGRPARFFSLTESGRDEFEQGYDDLAAGALRFLSQRHGPVAVAEFARERIAGVEARYAEALRDVPAEDRVQALALALSADGFAADARPTPAPATGEQVCQHHCPVAHVATEFPQLCEAETEMFARLLGTHVRRLSTIARGDGICTTHVPASAPSGAPSGTTPALGRQQS
jgi:predicted ArsR family transcriptional regulator